MPASVKFEHGGLGVLVTIKGEMDTALFTEQNAQFYTPKVLENLCYQIVDLREVENVDIDLASIKRLAETDKAMAINTPGFKIAIVVNSGVMEGLAQIYQRQAKCENLITRVFHTVTAARSWVAECVELDESA